MVTSLPHTIPTTKASEIPPGSPWSDWTDDDFAVYEQLLATEAAELAYAERELADHADRVAAGEGPIDWTDVPF